VRCKNEKNRSVYRGFKEWDELVLDKTITLVDLAILVGYEMGYESIDMEQPLTSLKDNIINNTGMSENFLIIRPSLSIINTWKHVYENINSSVACDELLLERASEQYKSPESIELI
jgi:hypothetical protein